jgi:hypothetical protein
LIEALFLRDALYETLPHSRCRCFCGWRCQPADLRDDVSIDQDFRRTERAAREKDPKSCFRKYLQS